MRARWRSAAMLATLLAAGALGGPVAAQGDPPGYGVHTGRTGLHWILDNPGPDPELPAVTCVYGGSNLRLKLFRIRQPVILANRAEGYRRQVVAWRARVEAADSPDGPWTPYKNTGWTRATAVAPYPVDLAPKELATDPEPLVHGLYRVAYDLRWFRANGTTIDGSAAHHATWYRLSSSIDTSRVEGGCLASVILRASRLAGIIGGFNGELEHSGIRGPHWVLDNPGPNPEYPAVTCEYDAASLLVGLQVRRPMILARNTGQGIQAQDVAWRAVVQASLTNTGTEAWGDVVHTTPWVRARATETSWAKLKPVEIDLDVSDYHIVRVVYRLRWYRGTSDEIIGRASHAPLTYGREFPSFTDWEAEHCLVQEA